MHRAIGSLNRPGSRTAKETAMPRWRRPSWRFGRIARLRLLMGGAAIVCGACALIARAQAQFVNSPPPPPPPPPVFNPSIPYTVPQPSYRPISPTTPNAVGGVIPDYPVTRTARTYRQASAPATRSVRHRRRIVVPASYPVACGYYGCVRTYPWAFPCQYYSSYCYPYPYYRPYAWYRW